MTQERKRKQSNTAAPATNQTEAPSSEALGVAAFEALDGDVISASGSLLSKGADAVSDGGSALGGLARAGLRAVGSLPLDDAAGGIADAARGVAGAAAGIAGSSAEAALSVTGSALSNAGDLVGPALEATGDVAGAVLGAAADAAGDILSS